MALNANRKSYNTGVQLDFLLSDLKGSISRSVFSFPYSEGTCSCEIYRYRLLI